MARFGGIQITRKTIEDWDYVLQIADDAGKIVRLEAGIEELDQIAAAVDAKLDEMVEAAEQLAKAS